MGRKKKECICEKCGERNVDNFYAGRKNLCKVCYNDKVKLQYSLLDTDKKQAYIDYNVERIKSWRLSNLIQYRLLSAKTRAKIKKIEFNLTEEIILSKLNEQNNKCFYSGVDLLTINEMENNWKCGNIHTLSIDRINSKLGYTEDNIVLASSVVNSMKNELTTTEFLNIIELIYNRKSDILN